MTTKKLSLYGMLLSLILVLGLVEQYIPLNIAVPGIKLGLSNIVLLFALYILDIRAAVILMLSKVVLLGFLFAGFQSFVFSLMGGIFSVAVMYFTKKTIKAEMIAASVLGSCAHVTGQIVAAILVLQNAAALYYWPILLLSAVITGILTGVAAKATITALTKSGFLNINKKD